MTKDKFETDEPGECRACGGCLMLEKVNLEDYQGGKLFMMEKVAAYVCQSCGEIWVPEPVIKEFESMIKTVKERKKKSPSTRTEQGRGARSGKSLDAARDKRRKKK